MLVMSLLGSVARLCVPLWFTAQPFSAFRGQHCEAAQEMAAGRVYFLLLPATKHVASRFAAALIDARSVSSFWCVSDTTANKGPRCSPPPQFTAMPAPCWYRWSLVWHETAHGVTSECLDPSWLGGRGQGLLYASSWQTPTSALCSYQLTSLAHKVSSQGEMKKKKKTQPSFFKSQVIIVLLRLKLYRGRFFFFYQQQKVLCSC